MSPQLWPYALSRFTRFGDFLKDCAKGSLPQYSFVEPSFVKDPNDEHPPHDVVAGEQFLFQIWQAISKSPLWAKTLLLITYDEHGGTYDHVMPPWGQHARIMLAIQVRRDSPSIASVFGSLWLQFSLGFRRVLYFGPTRLPVFRMTTRQCWLLSGTGLEYQQTKC
jgi:phospholipase C